MTSQHNSVQESHARGSIPRTCKYISLRQHFQTVPGKSAIHGPIPWRYEGRSVKFISSYCGSPEFMAHYIHIPCTLHGLIFGWMLTYIQVKSRNVSFIFSVFVRLSVRLFACYSPAPTGRICVKFDIGNIYTNMSRQSKFGKNRTTISANTIQRGLTVV
jgi:hypothetical protein